MKLKELDINSNDPNVLFLEDLTQSKQPKYIQTLAIGDDIIPRPMHMMYQTEVLQNLYIDYTSYGANRDGTGSTINFSQLIDACPPTLSSLITCGVAFTFNESISNITSITHLNIDSTNLTPDLAKVIETSFPKLSTLHLRGVIVSKLIISLPNHRLDDVKISFMDNLTQSNELLTETTSDGTIQCYAIKRINTDDSDTMFYIHDENKSVLKDDDSLVLKLTCAHVKKIRFQRHL